jgi:DNA-binding transcriptional MerR regulator
MVIGEKTDQSDSVTLTLSDTRYNTVMKKDERPLWTIDELPARVTEALSVGYGGVPSNRVRDVPDLRTIRYYTALGLLDRPAAMRGRTALYGSRHLLQLVAIKRLQAQGLSLAAVQERVLGLSDAALRRIVEPPVSKRDHETSATRGDSFWRLAAKIPVDNANGGASARAQGRADGEEPADRAAGSEFQTISLGNGLLLSLPARRGVDEADLRSIRAAAASLIEVLKLRGMIEG